MLALTLVFHEVLKYYYINDVIKYLIPDINKYIVHQQNVITYLEFTYMNYTKSQFSKH